MSTASTSNANDKVPKFRDVSCGSYHTAFISSRDELVVCGRDRLCLEGDHVATPIFFKPFQEDNIKVYTVALGPLHTV